MLEAGYSRLAINPEHNDDCRIGGQILRISWIKMEPKQAFNDSCLRRTKTRGQDWQLQLRLQKLQMDTQTENK